MITIRPSIFCFLGKVAPDLYGAVPLAIRKRLGAVPDVFAFVAVTQDEAAAHSPARGGAIELKLGTKRPKLPPFAGSLHNRLWQTITYAAAATSNIRVRTDALRRPEEAENGFQLVRGGPDIYIVECLSDTLGWEVAFALAEKVHARNETPPSAGRARGIFPLFHLPSIDEDLEREQALEGLRRLELLVKRGVLFPSIVLDRVNRNGHPLERWEDLTELLADFIALGSASEAAADIWRTFPQVADLHGADAALPGLNSIGLARFRFSRETLGEELGRYHQRDLKRALGRTFAVEPRGAQLYNLDQCRELIGSLVAMEASRSADGLRRVEDAVIAWVEALDSSSPAGAAAPLPLGCWAQVLDRLQSALFERMGDAAQRIENARQESESLLLESPLRESWIARISVLLPGHLAFFAAVPAFAFLGALCGFYFYQISIKGFLAGAAVGAILGVAAGSLLHRRWRKQTFTLGEFQESAFTQGFPVPRVLEHYTRRKQRQHLGWSGPGTSIQLWGELKSQVEPAERQRLEAIKARLGSELAKAKGLETELIFLDRGINALRERVESWRARLSEVEIWEPGRGFSGDIFPADGPRKVYEAFSGRAASEAALPAILAKVRPRAGAPQPTDLIEEVASAWGRERAQDLTLDRLLAILEDRPEDLLERLSEASAPLWPRPGDQDELLRCFGQDFASFARDGDMMLSVSDETVFLRVLGGIRSGELART